MNSIAFLIVVCIVVVVLCPQEVMFPISVDIRWMVHTLIYHRRLMIRHFFAFSIASLAHFILSCAFSRASFAQAVLSLALSVASFAHRI